MLRDATLPVLLIFGGLFLLAWNHGWLPERDALIGAALAAAGLAILILDGLTKKSIVAGPLLMAMGLSWYGYFELAWRSRLIIPLLMIFAGLLMLLARLSPLPERKEYGLLAPRERERDRL